MGKTILKVLCGIIAVSGFVAAIGAFSESAFAGLFMMLGSILLFPPTWILVRKLSGRNFPTWAFVVAGFSLAFVGSATLTKGDEEKAKGLGFANVADYRSAKTLGLNAEGYAKRQLEMAAAEKKKQDAAKEAEMKKDADCRSDVQCWSGKYELDALIACKPAIQKMAKYDYEWTDGITSPAFTKLAWNDKKKGTITYFGDEIKMQNGFGNFLRHRYACKYDPNGKAVLGVTLEAGRL